MKNISRLVSWIFSARRQEDSDPPIVPIVAVVVLILAFMITTRNPYGDNVAVAPPTVSAAQLEEQWKVKKARIEIEYGFAYIPGVAGFRPGDHFWVSPTEVFGDLYDLYEYVVGDDGSILDSTGIVAPAETLKGGRRDVIGPDGRPLFSAEIRVLNGEIWLIWNVVQGRAGWVKARTEKVCEDGKGSATLYRTTNNVVTRVAAGFVEVFETLDGTKEYNDERGIDWALMEGCRVAFMYYNSPATKRVVLFAPEGFDLRSLYDKPYMGAKKIKVIQTAGSLLIDVLP